MLCNNLTTDQSLLSFLFVKIINFISDEAGNNCFNFTTVWLCYCLLVPNALFLLNHPNKPSQSTVTCARGSWD